MHPNLLNNFNKKKHFFDIFYILLFLSPNKQNVLTCNII